MHHVKLTNKSVVFTHFFLSYLIFLMIPFVIFFSMLVPLMGELQKNSVRESAHMLNSVREIIDSKMEMVYANILNLNYNVTINNLLNSEEKEKDIAELLQATNEISYLEKEEDDIYIYLPEDEALLSSRGVYTKLEKLYGQIFSYGDMDYQEFHEKILNTPFTQKFLPETKVRTNSREYSAIVYLKKIPFGIKKGKSATVLMFIDSTYIDKQVKSNMQETGRWFGIYNSNQELLYQTDNSPENMGEFLESYSEEQKGSQEGYDIDGSIYTAVRSETNGWLFVSGILKKDLYAKVDQIRQGLLLLFFVYVVIGVGMAGYLAKRNLRPIYRILNLWDRKEGNEEGKIDEYQLLESHVQDILSENEELSVSNNDYLKKMKEIWIQRLVCGSYNTKEEIEELELSEITEQKCFQVIAVDFSSPALLMEDQSIDSLNEQRYSLKKCLMQLEMENMAVAEVSISQLGLLFYSGENLETFREKMKNQGKAVLDFLKKYHLGEYIRIGQGEAVEGVLHIGDSYIQAKCAARACLEYHQDVMSYNVIPRKSEKYYFPDQLRELLLDAVEKGNLKQVRSVMKVLNVENFEVRTLSKQQEEQFLEELHSFLLHLKNKDLIGEAEIEPEEILQGQDRFYSYVQKILYVSKERTDQAFSQKKKIQQELLSFIDEHYMDSNLCLGMVSSHFQLSESYCSYLFKKNYGVNFSSYLEKKRIEQARMLLLQGTYHVEEVGRRVGYNSPHVFRRAFRKVTGLNPSDIGKIDQ